MKVTLALLTAAVAASAAQPHGHHQHQHVHKNRRADTPPEYVTVPGPVEIVYVLNGKAISEYDVQQGIKNGSLVFASNGELTSNPAPAYEAPKKTSASVVSSSTTQEAWTSTQEASTSTTQEAKPTTSSAAITTSSAAAPSYASGSGSDTSSGTGVDSDFPDGQLDCDTFPSQYGAVAVEWTGLGGWTGVQCPGSGSGESGFTNIETVASGGSCREGSYCSYACPPGYLKTQWPTTQGSTGQSVGGLQCSNGKLHMTNPDLSSKLCMKGTDAVEVKVQNNMGQNVAICQTDYPGTESETVPVNVPAYGNSSLACPDEANYYQHEGSSTSAQFYVNPAGVPVEKACQWGSPSNPWGNYAPLNIGVGYKEGMAWLAIFQNAPTTDAKLDFCVEIVGDGLVGKCKYHNGQYCSGDNYDQCSSTTGCTVSISSGTATYVFSDA